MMLPIGNKKAFSLIEQIIAVAVLSLGIMLVYEAFFTSLGAFNHATRRLDAQRWMNEKIWDTEDQLQRTGMVAIGESGGVFRDKNKDFNWLMKVSLIDQFQSRYLCRVSLEVFWQEQTRRARLARAAYVRN
ncbi:prepilin-type N-terminal cleavage/methylation domain-containing protein [Candidatus Omnitrophota bacterium]